MDILDTVETLVPHTETALEAPVPLRLLEIESLDQIAEIMRRYEALNIPKEDPVLFFQTLTTDRNAWFLVHPAGLVYFTGVFPGISAMLHVLFWDGKLTKARALEVRVAVRQAAERFNLARVSAQFKWSNRAYLKFLRSVGFVYEGTLRKGWVEATSFEDMLLYGMISEEL